MNYKSLIKTAFIDTCRLIKNNLIIFLICAGFIILAFELKKISLFVIVCLISICLIND